MRERTCRGSILSVRYLALACLHQTWPLADAGESVFRSWAAFQKYLVLRLLQALLFEVLFGRRTLLLRGGARARCQSGERSVIRGRTVVAPGRRHDLAQRAADRAPRDPRRSRPAQIRGAARMTSALTKYCGIGGGHDFCCRFSSARSRSRSRSRRSSSATRRSAHRRCDAAGSSPDDFSARPWR